MKTKIDLEHWPRREHFEFFNQFEEPYHGVTVNIDCTIAYQFAKQNDLSFFLYYLYQSLTAAHAVEPFRLRIEEGKVYRYDLIDAGSTISRKNGTFGFANFIFYPDFREFHVEAKKVIATVSESNTLNLSKKNNVIRYSPLPFIDFTAHYRARRFAFKDSCPQIYFGKMTDKADKKTMPVSIHVHHALIDGVPLAQFIDGFQELMNKPAGTLNCH